MSAAVHMIVGSDGQLGRALFAHMRGLGKRVIGTTRRRGESGPSHIFLDLETAPSTWRFPYPVDVAVVAAGVTGLTACSNDPAGTARINVDGTIELVHRMVRANAFVVFLSTNLVFDGTMAFARPDDPVSPVTEYGRQKAAVERNISSLGNSVAIVRFTKILGAHNSLFDSWTQALMRGEVIHPFSDLYFSPVPLFFGVSVLSAVAEKLPAGIVQVSGERDISYGEAAIMGARILHADPGLVQPIPAVQTAGYAGPLPAHTTLDTTRLRTELALAAPDVEWTISAAFRDPAALETFPFERPVSDY
jgi:dTDP-4-dehydrorhamnose reductase